MSRTDAIEMTVRGHDLTREEVLRQFREGEEAVGADTTYNDEDLIVKTYPPLYVQRWWPNWMPAPIWIVRLEKSVSGSTD